MLSHYNSCDRYIKPLRSRTCWSVATEPDPHLGANLQPCLPEKGRLASTLQLTFLPYHRPTVWLLISTRVLVTLAQMGSTSNRCRVLQNLFLNTLFFFSFNMQQIKDEPATEAKPISLSDRISAFSLELMHIMIEKHLLLIMFEFYRGYF